MGKRLYGGPDENWPRGAREDMPPLQPQPKPPEGGAYLRGIKLMEENSKSKIFKFLMFWLKIMIFDV